MGSLCGWLAVQRPVCLAGCLVACLSGWLCDLPANFVIYIHMSNLGSQRIIYIHCILPDTTAVMYTMNDQLIFEWVGGKKNDKSTITLVRV